MKLDYGYGTTTNNGNVMSQIITAPSLTVNQCYGYDSLNRLTSAEEKSGGTACAGTQQWKQAFTYDRFGNRNFDPVNTTSNVLGPNPTISQSTNRIGLGQNYGYDFAGNLTSEPATNTNGIVYDAENRQTQYTKSGQATNSYYYDGDGHRVKKIDSTGTTVFVYDVGGQLIGEYTAGNPSSGGTSYLTNDHLGSTRVVVKSDGTTTTTTRHDYLPFGEEIQAGIGGRTAGQGYVADNVRQKFTQKERDSESGLDYFGARYYSSAQGRFTSIDSGPFTPADPQNWNRLAYVQSNPMKFVDRMGNELYLTGDDVEYFRDYLSKKSGYNLSVDKKGKVKIEKGDRNKEGTSKELADVLKTVIGASEKVALSIQKEIPNAFVDNMEDALREHSAPGLDTHHVRDLDRLVPELGVALVGHVIEESWRLKKGDDIFDTQDMNGRLKTKGAHSYGKDIESGILSGFTGVKESIRTEVDKNPTWTFIYTSVQYDFMLKSRGPANIIDIADVKRKKLP